MAAKRRFETKYVSDKFKVTRVLDSISKFIGSGYGGFFRGGSATEKCAQQPPPSAKGNSGIGEIERRPIPTLIMQGNKVHHMTQQQPIYQIANTAAKDQAQRHHQPTIPRAQPKQPHHNEDTDGQGNPCQEPTLPPPCTNDPARPLRQRVWPSPSNPRR